MKNFFLFLLVFAFSECMELSTKNEIFERIHKGFRAFDLDPSIVDIYESDCNSQVRAHTIRHWDGGTYCVFLTKAVQRNPNLSEFAGHCIAASVKNAHSKKILQAYFGILGFSLSLPLFIMFLSNDPLYSACAGVATLSIPFASLSDRVCKKVDRTIADFFDLRAFSHACDKLVQRENLKPVATCYAFTSLVSQSHQQDKISRIKKCLAKNNLTITCSLTNSHEARTAIWKDATCVCKGEYRLPIAPQSQDDSVLLEDASVELDAPFITQEGL